MNSIDSITKTFQEKFHRKPFVFIAPGRINLIGERPEERFHHRATLKNKLAPWPGINGGLPTPYETKTWTAFNLDLNGISWELMGVNGMISPKCLSLLECS